MLLKEKFKNHQIVLASQSPRRKELLSGLDINFDTIALNVDESYSQNLKREEITEYLCKKKADAYNNWTENTILITADTIVWFENQALEKPAGREEAIQMLQKLSGQKHDVITSIGIFSPEKKHILTDTTQVTFGDLDKEEIAYYVDNYQPYDKAGSYGVQEWIGYIGVKEMVGSYFTVMGLPVYELNNVLKKF